MKTLPINIVFLLAFAMAACGPVQPATPNGQDNSSSTLPPVLTETVIAPTQTSVELPTQGVNTPMPPSITTPSSTDLQDLVEKAKQDMSTRFSIPVDQIILVRSAQVTWSDSSLGCPQPDMAYMEVLTPGYLVVLKSGDKQYEYHGGRDKTLNYCKNPLPPSSESPNSI